MRRIPHFDKQPLDQRATKAVMRAVARRIIHLTDEIKAHEKRLRVPLEEAAPQLLGEFGIGAPSRQQLYVAWSHPGRCRNGAAHARLAGVAPIPTTSPAGGPPSASDTALKAAPYGIRATMIGPTVQ